VLGHDIGGGEDACANGAAHDQHRGVEQAQTAGQGGDSRACLRR
jgi:hypothetical protein